MDYVVFGIGFGATLVLLGWALRTVGPGLRFRPPDDGEGVLSGAALLSKLSWTRFVSALGAVVATGGVVMLLSTFVAIALSPRDRVGTIVVLSCFFLILITACVWAWIYIGRYGTLGILPDRTKSVSPLRTPPETEVVLRQPRDARTADPGTRGLPVAVPDPVAGPAVPSEGPSVSRFARPADALIDSTMAAEPVAGPPVFDTADMEPDTDIHETGPVVTSNEDQGLESVEPVDDVVVDNDHEEPGEGTAPEDRLGNETASSADDQTPFVDVLPRPAPTSEESGRAEALRNLRARRSSRYSSDQN